MSGAIPPLPQYAFMARCSIKKAEGQLYLLPSPYFRKRYKFCIAVIQHFYIKLPPDHLLLLSGSYISITNLSIKKLKNKFNICWMMSNSN
jgi:hypothetical protein